MGAETMGKVLVAAEIENLADVMAARDGRISPAEVRRIIVPGALVDTGATTLSLPRRLCEELGLRQFTTRRIRTATGICEVRVYDAVRLSVQGRDCVIDVAELPDECPVLVGQVPLELMDFVVDPRGQRLIGNPEHGGQWMLDMF